MYFVYDFIIIILAFETLTHKDHANTMVPERNKPETLHKMIKVQPGAGDTENIITYLLHRNCTMSESRKMKSMLF